MKKQLYSIEQNLANLGLELDDFFIFSLWKTSREVGFQGNFNAELFGKLSSNISADFTYTHYEKTKLHVFVCLKNNYRFTLS